MPGTEAAAEWIERGREAAEISVQAAASMDKSARRMRVLVIGGAAVALVILLVWLALPRWLRRDAEVTMNVYTHASYDFVKAEILRISGFPIGKTATVES